jgi:hypothetical protein
VGADEAGGQAGRGTTAGGAETGAVTGREDGAAAGRGDGVSSVNPLAPFRTSTLSFALTETGVLRMGEPSGIAAAT